jgi:hypothetical protein
MQGVRRWIKRFVPEPVLEGRRYWAAHGRLPNLLRPTRFTEKIVLRKLYDRNPLFPLCSDKHAVRRYVSDRIGDANLVPLIAVTDRPEDLLDLASWRMTAIKPNHASQMIQINGDEEPSPDQKRRHVSRFGGWLAVDFSTYHNEWQYAEIPRKLMVERNIAEPGTDLLEWKFHCFRQPDGRVVTMLQVIVERSASKRMAFYLDDGEAYRLAGSLGEALPTIHGADPLLAEARRKSVALSREFDYVRVDWMVGQGGLFFSELTFTPGAGISTSFGGELDRRLGPLWTRGSGERLAGRAWVPGRLRRS